MTTYWLYGKVGFEPLVPKFDPQDDEKLREMLDENQIK